MNKKILTFFLILVKLFLKMVAKDTKNEVKKLHIGRKIRELRKKSGLILQDLSDRTGLSKPLLSQIEKEMVSPPIATLLNLKM